MTCHAPPSHPFLEEDHDVLGAVALKMDSSGEVCAVTVLLYRGLMLLGLNTPVSDSLEAYVTLPLHAGKTALEIL